MSRARAAFALTLSLSVSTAAAAQTATCALPEQNQIIGTVAGQPITRCEVEAVWRSKDPATYFSFERQRHEMTMHAMQEVVAERLLQREAERRGTTVEGLMAAEVSARVKPVSDEAITAEFERMKGSFPYASLVEARPMVLSSLSQRQATDARASYVGELLARSSALIETIEKGPRQTVAIDDDDPTAGPIDAPVTVVLFSDFECPYCRQAEPVLAELQETFRGQLRLVWKDFPLPIHQNARAAAKAARCADEQGAFWKYRDELFKNQNDLGEQRLRGIANALALDDRAFSQCLASNRFEAVIDGKIEEGRLLGVTSTPTIFVNGAAVTGAVPAARLEALIRDELKSVRR